MTRHKIVYKWIVMKSIFSHGKEALKCEKKRKLFTVDWFSYQKIDKRLTFYHAYINGNIIIIKEIKFWEKKYLSLTQCLA